MITGVHNLFWVQERSVFAPHLLIRLLHPSCKMIWCYGDTIYMAYAFLDSIVLARLEIVFIGIVNL